MLTLLIYTKFGVLGLDTFKILRDINIMLTINANLVAVFSEEFFMTRMIQEVTLVQISWVLPE